MQIAENGKLGGDDLWFLLAWKIWAHGNLGDYSC